MVKVGTLPFNVTFSSTLLKYLSNKVNGVTDASHSIAVSLAFCDPNDTHEVAFFSV